MNSLNHEVWEPPSYLHGKPQLILNLTNKKYVYTSLWNHEHLLAKNYLKATNSEMGNHKVETFDIDYGFCCEYVRNAPNDSFSVSRESSIISNPWTTESDFILATCLPEQKQWLYTIPVPRQTSRGM